MNITIQVENIRCGGCTTTITKKLMALDGIKAVDIDIDQQLVRVDVDNEAVRPAVVVALTKMGYPEKGTVAGLDSLKGKAKSVVSCAIGKVS